MKKFIYLIILSVFLTFALLDHDSNGVAYNPLFHKHGSDDENEIAMPCGLGGTENHKH